MVNFCKEREVGCIFPDQSFKKGFVALKNLAKSFVENLLNVVVVDIRYT